jgi:hypothetical protein
VIAQNPVDVLADVVSHLEGLLAAPVRSLLEKDAFIRSIVLLIGPPGPDRFRSKVSLNQLVVQINPHQFLIGPDPDLLLAIAIRNRVIGSLEDQVTVPMNVAVFPLGPLIGFCG